MSLNWIKQVADVVPLILPFIPGLPSVLIPFIVKGIQIAETIPGATGPDKLKAAITEVNNGVAAVNAAKPGTVDAQSVSDAVVHGINATISTLNAINRTSTPPVTLPTVNVHLV